MNNPMLRTGALLLVGLAVIALYASSFVVPPTQQALALQLGRVRDVITSPGLHF